jgi:D-3-phosphoglycerate dehydrogenase
MRVLGYDPGITVEHAWRLSSQVEHVTALEQLLRRADIVTVHVPLVEATRGLLGTAALATLHRSAVVVNFARGPIVDEAAVVEALESGQLRAYICDFPTPALNKRAQVVTLPHLGASTVEAEENCARMAADQLRDFLVEGTIVNSVNFPNADLPRSAGSARIAIANTNVPNMVGQISTLVARAGLNIADLLNKSRGELAYTIVDVEAAVPDTLMDQVRAIDGVLSARLL